MLFNTEPLTRRCPVKINSSLPFIKMFDFYCDTVPVNTLIQLRNYKIITYPNQLFNILILARSQ